MKDETTMPRRALGDFAAVLSTQSAEALSHFTCQEFDSVLRLLVAAGHRAAAINAVIGHATGDDDQDDVHHDVYLADGTDDQQALATAWVDRC